VTETVRKRLVVTFDDGLPLGTHGVFTHEGQKWIAVPLPKYNAILAAADRMVSVLNRARTQLTRRVSSNPDSAVWIVPILQTLATDELVSEKIKAQTS
jgi:hypothetical protein